MDRAKQQCWEYTRCGWGPGGPKAIEDGPCPAATATDCDGINDGRAGGRVCWSVADTRCDQHLGAATTGAKFIACLRCPFFHRVEQEQGRFFDLGL